MKRVGNLTADEVIEASKKAPSLRGIGRVLGLPEGSWSGLRAKMQSLGVYEQCSHNVLNGGVNDGGHMLKIVERKRRIEEAEANKDRAEGDRDKATAELQDFVHENRDVTTAQGRKNFNADLLIRDLKAENKKLKHALVEQHDFFDRVVNASTEPLAKPKFRVKVSNGRPVDERGILLPIFDMQLGTSVTPDDTVGSIGHFNFEILQERAARYVEVVAKIIHAQSHNFKIGPIVFALGGDMVEGDEIFDDQAWQIEMAAPEQVIKARDLLSWMLDAIMEVGAEVGAKQASVICVPGNHGRRGKKNSGRKKKDSFDVLTYQLIEERMKNYPLFTFAIEPAGNATFEMMGSIFSMIHGDEVKGWGSLPFYGLTRQDAKMIRTLNVIPDYVLLGHHHQPASIPIGYGEHFMSGNWVGATNLSAQVGSNTPQQMVFVVDPDHGVLDRIPVMLDDVRKPTPTIHRTA